MYSTLVTGFGWERCVDCVLFLPNYCDCSLVVVAVSSEGICSPTAGIAVGDSTLYGGRAGGLLAASLGAGMRSSVCMVACCRDLVVADCRSLYLP